MSNLTLFQFFHWYYPNDGNLWKHCAKQAAHLKYLGITHMWLPPAYKSAMGAYEPGYAVYDLFDLGEFDQKGSLPTKYGTKEDYLACIKTLQEQGISVLADIVLNHKMGADEAELVKVKEVHPDDRKQISEQEQVIEAYTKFTFPARKQKYSSFIWDYHCFTGVSVTTNEGTRIYSILNEYGHDWEEMLDDEMGNFDYLMGSDIEFRNAAVRDELKWWGKWYVETTGIDGFRLDAVKHITPPFYREWLEYMRNEFKKEFFCVAEYWHHNADILLKWNEAIGNQSQLFDVPLHYRFFHASNKKRDYDLRTIFDDTVIQKRPERAVTFVDNHDSQPFQGLESFVEYWFKPLANALILLREQGIPCVFFPSYYGASYEERKENENVQVELSPVTSLHEMLLTRHHLAYGQQNDYFDFANVIGWVRQGIPEKKHSGCAVVLSNGDEGTKYMDMGPQHANAVFIDITGNRSEKIKTNEHGQAEFKVNGESAAVWIREEAVPLIKPR